MYIYIYIIYIYNSTNFVKCGGYYDCMSTLLLLLSRQYSHCHQLSWKLLEPKIVNQSLSIIWFVMTIDTLTIQPLWSARCPSLWHSIHVCSVNIVHTSLAQAMFVHSSIRDIRNRHLYAWFKAESKPLITGVSTGKSRYMYSKKNLYQKRLQQKFVFFFYVGLLGGKEIWWY